MVTGPEHPVQEDFREKPEGVDEVENENNIDQYIFTLPTETFLSL